MASNATTPRTGHVDRFVRSLLPSRRQVALFIATEIALSLLGTPVLVHLAVGGVLHLLATWSRHRD